MPISRDGTVYVWLDTRTVLHLRTFVRYTTYSGTGRAAVAEGDAAHAPHDQPVALVRHLPDEREIYIHRPEVPAAAQDQRLAYRVLEPVMTLLFSWDDLGFVLVDRSP